MMTWNAETKEGWAGTRDVGYALTHISHENQVLPCHHMQKYHMSNLMAVLPGQNPACAQTIPARVRVGGQSCRLSGNWKP